MFFSTINALALAIVAFEDVQAFWRLPCGYPVVTERIDPIVNSGPSGTYSPHVHLIVGSNAISSNATYDSLRQGTCSSCQVVEDMSSYWVPTLYWYNNDTSNPMFESVTPTGGLLIYYLQRRAAKLDRIVAFPEGFRMIAGDMSLRSYSDTREQKAISYNCLDYDNPHEQTAYLPKQACPDGLRAQVTFPSCWNGKDLDSEDHRSHMAYPDGIDTGKCPESHPIRMMTLFFELTWDVSKYGDSMENLVWSFGDATGYGFHADFINGWDTKILQNAINRCNDPSGTIEACKEFTVKEVTGCTKPQEVREQVTGQLKALPGCNNVTYGPEPATVKNCPPKDPDYGLYVDQGCFDAEDAMTIGLPNLLKDSEDMSIETCKDLATEKESPYFALLGGTKCFVGSFDTSKPSDSCSIACKGSSDENCGGPNSFRVFKKDDNHGGNPLPDYGDWKNLGCLSDAEGGIRALTLAPLSEGEFHIEGCIAKCESLDKSFSAMEYSSECYCGDYIQSPNYPISYENHCKMTCRDNSTEICGGPNALSLFHNPNIKPDVQTYTNPPAPWSYHGCYQDLLDKKTLNGTSWFVNTMTVDACVKFCQSNKFKYAGLEYSTQCFCGNTLDEASIAFEFSNIPSAGPAYGCNMPCGGDKTSFCGGPNRLNIYASA